ncbi:elongator complex protein 1-like isoform X1 [Populus alba x Populus x berolinensis]|uniref:Elongator complex protein 1-like isoform X1 n=1 Tax=Populus alba x Populus x berolinensis TaxID=444605 RepID=A0AAD6Q9V6_9ROSI|nr:elongator complex protein 1-like isoform X1 [Populus alba x Populus x berolinensis]
MKNLKLYREISQNLELQSPQEVLVFSAFDIERNRLFFASSANIIYTAHLSSFQNGKSKGLLLPSEINQIELEDGDLITAFDYMMEKEALIIGTENGLLLLHNIDDNSTEIVGQVEGGVKCISRVPMEICLLFLLVSDKCELDGKNMFGSFISWRGIYGGVLEWMPSGAKIAAVYDRKVENRCPDIAFYERNGLVRSSFSIKEAVDATVESLKWNCGSDLVASVVRCEKYDAVKLWFLSNNHWYLKHEVRYSRQDELGSCGIPVKPLQLICWTLGGQITIYNFTWISAVTENSTALVIDDSKILVTPLSLSLMPPPLHLFSLKFPSSVRDLALYSNNSKNRVAAFLSDGSLGAVELPDPDTWEDLEEKEFTVEASISETGSGWHAKISHRNYMEGLVIGIAPNPAKNRSAFVQFDGGNVVEYTSMLAWLLLEGSTKHDDMSFSSSCPWMSVAKASDSGSLKPLLFGLDDIGRLHFGGKVLCNNCSSFSCYSNLADQTTRGNLESIHPRKLVLASIVNALIQRRFRDALLLVRRHRIDFNVIVDYCGWQTFLQSASEFVKQIGMNLMSKNPQLCPLGLQMITDPAKKMQVLEAWGDHLSDEKCFEDAAITYLCCSSLENALKAYRSCGDWSGVLTVAGLLKLEKDELMQLAHDLCEELQALGKPGEAAKIALEYCGDVNRGINLLISARDWRRL